jgi:hypothetical protein
MKWNCCLAVLIALAYLFQSAVAREPTAAEALESDVELAFIQTPLEDVLGFLTDYARVKIDVEKGVDNQQPVTVRAKGITLRSALRLLTASRGLKFEPRGDRIVISRASSPDVPEYGYGLKPEDAQEGWIALFDGETTFGWTNAKVLGDQLVGGQTSASFGDYLLRAYIKQPGQLTQGGKTIDVKAGPLYREVLGRGPIVLHQGTSLRMLAIQPLGLKRLFNGQDLTGWKRIDRDKLPPEKRPTWQVEEGAIHAAGGPGALESADRYGDFVLQADIRTRAKYANGGVFFRSVPGDVMNGYEAQVYNRMIDDDPAKPFKYSTGSLDDRQLARRVVSRDFVQFRMTVVANGPHIATWVNGYQLIDWTDTRSADDNPRKGLRLEPGTIQLQAHDAETDVEFHAINIAPLK